LKKSRTPAARFRAALFPARVIPFSSDSPHSGPRPDAARKRDLQLAADPQLEKEIADAGLCSHLWLR
jgi:hypothetical protein